MTGTRNISGGCITCDDYLWNLLHGTHLGTPDDEVPLGSEVGAMDGSASGPVVGCDEGLGVGALAA